MPVTKRKIKRKSMRDKDLQSVKEREGDQTGKNKFQNITFSNKKWKLG